MKAVVPAIPAFASIEYRAPNPLGRSRFVTLHSDGRVVVTDVTRTAAGVREQRWVSRDTTAAVVAVSQMLTAMETLPERPARAGIPGETIVELRTTPLRGTVWIRSKWLGDPVPAFDAPEAALSALAHRAVASPPEYDGPATRPP